MAMGNEELRTFVQRFRNLQLQRDTSDELTKDLLVYCENIETTLRNENSRLASQLSDAQLDITDATKSRRELQQLLQQTEHRLDYIAQDNELLKNRNPYVVILIDGDGLLFKDSFASQGFEGGKRATYALRAAIAKECGDHANEVEVICRNWANLAGLTRAMRRDGCLALESDFKDFSLGFTQGKASFDFVDVGYGKERADTKIKEATKWHLRNVNCKQVILGISHDAGYAPYLDEILRDDETRRRITILEGFPTVRELRATNVNILNLSDTIFRSEKLVDRTPRLPTPPQVMASPPSVPAAPVSSTPSSATGPSSSWAGVISNASPPPTIVLPIQPKQAPTKAAITPQGRAAKPVPWNPGVRGLDPPIQVNQTILDTIKKRKDRDKLCNNHYLRGPCAKGDSCCFEHKYRPSGEEKIAIAFLARLNPCTNGQECEVDDCIYGHHCPSVRDGQCTHPYCKFRPDDHPPNTKFKPTYSYGEY